MPKYKPVIEIDKHDEVGYRILNGLSKNHEYVIHNLNAQSQDILHKIGIHTSSFNLEYPVVWHTANRSHREKRFLKLPPELEIDEEQGNNKVFFRFRKRSIV
jgi:hypothetical protein